MTGSKPIRDSEAADARDTECGNEAVSEQDASVAPSCSTSTGWESRPRVIVHAQAGDDWELDIEAALAENKTSAAAAAAAAAAADASAKQSLWANKRNVALAASLAAVLLLLALILGLSLGLGLKHHHPTGTSRTSPAAQRTAGFPQHRAVGPIGMVPIDVSDSEAPSAPAAAPAAQGPASTPATPTALSTSCRRSASDYDFCEVLGMSFLFYEAQRSGKLPASNRIKWRGDSGLDHKGPDGRDVSGGWYDAGDNVKFNLPMAWSATVLAWSLVDFADGYKAAGQYETALDNVKWAADYFVKCIGDGSDVVVQVGNGGQDHILWRRPEDVPGPVPVYSVTPDKPGSDVVGAMGAALAATSVAFQDVDPGYSKQLLAASKKAYKFATAYTGKYTASIPDAVSFYPSTNFMDDVALNALWLYLSTGDKQYKAEGLAYYMKHYNNEDGSGVWNIFDWDSNSWAAALLLTRLFPENPVPRARLDKFVSAWTKGGDSVTLTPKGLAFSGPWGSLRHAGNAMFLIKEYAVGNTKLKPAEKRAIDCTVKQQLGYMLGDSGRSFVVGFGKKPPQRPHHRGAACPSPITAPCSWADYETPKPNPHILYGALVGGPGADDSYEDKRSDFQKNEVAVDYNAGFTGALAAAVQDLEC